MVRNQVKMRDFLQLLALEDMGVKAEDLLMYSQVQVSQCQ